MRKFVSLLVVVIAVIQSPNALSFASVNGVVFQNGQTVFGEYLSFFHFSPPPKPDLELVDIDDPGTRFSASEINLVINDPFIIDGDADQGFVYKFDFRFDIPEDLVDEDRLFTIIEDQADVPDNRFIIADSVIRPGAAVYPQPDAINIPTGLRFEWEASRYSTLKDYHVQVGRSPDFSDPSAHTINRNIFGDNYLIVDRLEANTTYYWRVRAIDGDWKMGWSQVAVFTTGEEGGWRELANIIESDDIHTVTAAFAPDNGSVLLGTGSQDEGRIIQLRKKGLFWFVSKTTGTQSPVAAMHAVDNDIIVRSHRDILRSTDGGANYTVVFSNQEQSAYSASAIASHGEILLGTSIGEIQLYEQGAGGYERTLAESISDKTVSAVYSAPDGRLYAGTAHEEQQQDESGMYRSDDGGLQWRRLVDGLPEALSVTAIVEADDGSITIANGAANGGMYRSRDQGESWTTVQGLPNGAISILVKTPNGNLLAVSASAPNVVYRSIDHGLIWDIFDDELPFEEPIAALNVRMRHELVAVTSGGRAFVRSYGDALGPVVYPQDGADNIPLAPNISWAETAGASLYHVQLSTTPEFSLATGPKDDRVSVANVVIDDSTLTTHFTRVHDLRGSTRYYWRIRSKRADEWSDWSVIREFETAQDIAASVDGVEETPSAFHVRCLPNPIADAATITFELDTPQRVAIRIYDAKGALRAVVADAEMTAGSQVVHWMTGSLNSGRYVIRITAGSASVALPVSFVR